jgi:hemerythrin-like domain-containing protein
LAAIIITEGTEMKTRRTFLAGTASIVTSTLALPLGALTAHTLIAQTKTPAKPAPKKEAEEDVSTNEDLMREHGVLNRILLIYDEALRRMQANEKFDATVVVKSAGLIKSFIEDYHEKLEEDHIFPRFEQSGKLVELTVNLRAQHAMGRRVTDRIVATAKSGDMQTLRASLAAFNRMYRPHEAREDTVLFPALHGVVSKHEYDAMGEEFERIERKTFGGDGFDMAVDQVTELEKQFGIYDISQFTPEK